MISALVNMVILMLITFLISLSIDYCLVTSNGHNHDSSGWVDSGCTVMSTGLEQELSDIRPSHEVRMEVANGEIIVSDNVGSIGPIKGYHFNTLGDAYLC
jgi:hypothetical protein